MSYLFSVNRYLDLSGAVDGWAGKLAGGSLGLWGWIGYALNARGLVKASTTAPWPPEESDFEP